ncbi:hypothetical protein OWV82_025872 [Melia azedarach]|nr:hypothetical protein OWV82_026247 [Melia azedarach]KAJ4700214.1 hypothetical protein OWV82_025867 [Melia azedarach]KAJ4700219.1 hypothetical protein OWV82_025872 [Melia azedarach]
MPPGWDCLVRAPSWPASKPLLSRPGVFREWRLAAGHRAHCTLLAARARAVTPARTPPALPAPMCQRELSKDWPRLSSCGRGVNLCLAPRIARGASLLPRLAPERSVLVHRTVDAPSASVIPQAPLWPCGCVRYPVLLTRAREFEGFVAPIRLAPSRARGGLEACSVFLACPAILRTAASAHGASPVLSDAERYAWARGRLGLAVPKLRAFVLDANDCRARLDLAQRVVRASASPRNATWLILPVVICLSQRLSHACVSMN